MARIEHVHHRLERWAMWVARGRGTGGGTLAMFEGERDEEVQPQARIPIVDEECWRTEDAIGKLEPMLSETVAAYYLIDSGPTQRRLGISAATLSQRITDAHRKLDAMWRDEKLAQRPVCETPSWYAGVLPDK